MARFAAAFSLGMLFATVLMWVVGHDVERTVRDPSSIERPLTDSPSVEGSATDPSTTAWTRLCGSNASESLDHLIEKVSQETGVETALLAAVMTKESTCNPDAVGSSGEIGLNQINPSVWVSTLQEEGLIEERDDLFDPDTNLRCSAYILTDLLRRTDGDLWTTLRKYNGSGPRARRYADSVHGIYESLGL